MPRGRKKALTLDEKIEMLNDQIVETEVTLKDLKAQLKDAIKEKEEANLKKLYEAVQAKGLSVDEALDKISKLESTNE